MRTNSNEIANAEFKRPACTSRRAVLSATTDKLIKKHGKVVRIICTVQHETKNALLIDDGYQEMWLPKSIIEVAKVDGGRVEIVVPEWLASKRGLI